MLLPACWAAPGPSPPKADFLLDRALKAKAILRGNTIRHEPHRRALHPLPRKTIVRIVKDRLHVRNSLPIAGVPREVLQAPQCHNADLGA